MATTTKFNESYLLKGVNADGEVAKLTYNTANAAITDIALGGKTLTDEEALQDAVDNQGVDADKAFETMEELLAQAKEDLNEAGAGDIKNITTDSDGTMTVEAFADLNEALEFSLHVGADSTDDNKIALSISMMSARGLGVNGLKVSGDIVAQLSRQKSKIFIMN